MKISALFRAVAVAGAAGGVCWLLFTRFQRRSPLPLAAWLPGLIERHGRAEAERLVQQAEQRCRQLIAGISPRTSPVLRVQLVQNILPGLAMYQTLLEKHQGDRQAALSEIKPLFKTWTEHLYGRLMRSFRWLPAPFLFFRLSFAIQRRQFADNIFKTHMIENSARRIAMDQFGCPYLETLAAHGAPELTPFYCQIDDWMAEMLPPQIAFRRTQTLARGGDRCDFRYEHVSL